MQDRFAQPQTLVAILFALLLQQLQIGDGAQQPLLELRPILIGRLQPERFHSQLEVRVFPAENFGLQIRFRQAVRQRPHRLARERKFLPQRFDFTLGFCQRTILCC